MHNQHMQIKAHRKYTPNGDILHSLIGNSVFQIKYLLSMQTGVGNEGSGGAPAHESNAAGLTGFTIEEFRETPGIVFTVCIITHRFLVGGVNRL
jgi:hypothetical protein